MTQQVGSPRDTRDRQQLSHQRRRQDDLLQHVGLHRHRMTFIQHFFNEHVDRVKVVSYGRLGNIAEVGSQGFEE